MGDITENLDSGNTSDLRMMERAIRNEWPISAEDLMSGLKGVRRVLNDPDASDRNRMIAVKILAGLKAQNDENARRNAGQPDVLIEHSGNVTVTPDLSKLNLQELDNLRNALKPLGE